MLIQTPEILATPVGALLTLDWLGVAKGWLIYCASCLAWGGIMKRVWINTHIWMSVLPVGRQEAKLIGSIHWMLMHVPAWTLISATVMFCPFSILVIPAMGAALMVAMLTAPPASLEAETFACLSKLPSVRIRISLAPLLHDSRGALYLCLIASALSTMAIRMVIHTPFAGRVHGLTCLLIALLIWVCSLMVIPLARNRALAVDWLKALPGGWRSIRRYDHLIVAWLTVGLVLPVVIQASQQSGVHLPLWMLAGHVLLIWGMINLNERHTSHAPFFAPQIALAWAAATAFL
ncbi:hypothetical protein KSF73_05260 [Burkholderiaceae bacterium DAT-1]|nr:hypothetical protein [Burkholderiaceae bacterium DAT-1]